MIQLPAYLTGFSSKSDGSASVRFATQELTASDFATLKENLNEYGYLLFKPNEFKVDDIPTEDVEDKNKTPSKRQRALIYLIWQRNGMPDNNFDGYYRMRMEQNIDKLKKELDDF